MYLLKLQVPRVFRSNPPLTFWKCRNSNPQLPANEAANEWDNDLKITLRVRRIDEFCIPTNDIKSMKLIQCVKRKVRVMY